MYVTWVIQSCEHRFPTVMRIRLTEFVLKPHQKHFLFFIFLYNLSFEINYFEEINIIPKFQFRVLTRDTRCIFSWDRLSLLHFVTLIADSYCPEPQMFFLCQPCAQLQRQPSKTYHLHSHKTIYTYTIQNW